MAGDDWTSEELVATVEDYFDMYAEFLAGAPVNKSAHRRVLLPRLRDRTEGAIEFKRRNISAVLSELRFDYLDGYRPAVNVQGALRDVVASQLRARSDILMKLQRIVDEPASPAIRESVPRLELVAAPERQEAPRVVRENVPFVPIQASVDYQAREASNRSLGQAGELAVMEFEYRRLRHAGNRTLAKKIEHVSNTRGDGLGFDVLSFETSGQERLIEVKTTRLAEMTPFFLTRNEVEVSSVRHEHYSLYRLYRFDAGPKLFILPGSLRESCRLDPILYRGEAA